MPASVSIHESHDVKMLPGMRDPDEDDDPRISFSEEHGVVVVRDRRMFRRGHEAFCRRLVETAARLPGARLASVCLGPGTCRLEFNARFQDSERMANRFAECVSAATPELREDHRPDESDIGWATLMAFPSSEGVSCWEVVHEAADRLRIRNAILRSDPAIARRLDKELRKVAGIVSCRVVGWSRDQKIRYDPAQRADSAVVEAAESCLRQLLRLAADRAAAKDEENPEVAKGMRPAWYLALAGGSFGLA
jgi:hypothetical protein